MSQDNIEEKQAIIKQAYKTVKAYELAMNSTSNTGTLEDAVFQLFGGGRNYVDKPLFFRMGSLSMLKLLTDEKLSKMVRKEIGDYIYPEFVEMLHNMITFCEYMDTENFRAHFIAYLLKTHGESYENPERVIEEFERKMKSVRVKTNNGL